ncbi:MAG: hypothetical protein DSY79_01500, partial [Chloroflexi bacterium]
MLQMNHATRQTPSRRLSLALIAVLSLAVLLAMFSGTASAQSEAAIGRGFTGVVKSVSATNGLLAVESKGILFQLGVNDTTIINVPPDQDVGLTGLPVELSFKIAGLADGPITDANGIATPEIHTAQKLIVIPGRATRSHKRTIASDKQGDDLTALDADGVKTELKGRGAGIEKGESLIILVQKPGRGSTKEKVRGLFKAKTVTDRLDRLAEAEAEDPIKASILAGLRDRRDDEQEKRLRRTADNAEMAADLIERWPLSRCFRVAANLIGALAKQARRLHDRGRLTLVKELPASLCSSRESALITGLTAPRPLRGDGAEFESVVQLESAAQTIALIAYKELWTFGFSSRTPEELSALLLGPPGAHVA